MRWITRERARVDRIACPWLITRFIDPKPEFLFVPAREVLAAAERERAIPYDVPNVELGHHGAQCSFDAFIDRYELSEPALVTLAATVPLQPRVLFVCLHGAAKSVIGAAHFRRLAAARGLSIGAVAVGTEPDPQLAPGAVKGLAGDGLTAGVARPRPVTLYDLDTATRVVSFGCDVVAARGQRVEQWDVPAVSEGYAAARDRIVANVERLVGELAGGR